jgi:phosphate transport system ATP-binding protein
VPKERFPDNNVQQEAQRKITATPPLPEVGQRPSANKQPIEIVRAEAANVDFFYGDFQALKNINIRIFDRHITALIGPSGCGKSTFLRTLNRMNDLIEGARVSGSITIDGVDVNGPTVDPAELRKRVGMVFQRPNPFPMSIWDNVAYGPASTARKTNRLLARSWNARCVRPRCGTRSRTSFGKARWRFPAASSNGCASRAFLPSNRK